MKRNTFQPFFLSVLVNAQQNKQKTDTLQEVVITSSRIDLPFKEKFQNHSVDYCEDIKIRVTNVADALQQIAGIDVRRRGTSGTQADLYIRVKF
jgi:iron complex outermembrane receptor protein